MENKAQFLKGCARTLVLQLLLERPMYGYELASELDRRSSGIFALGQGTLYPLLYSLETKGQIRVTREELSVDQGRKRRYYALTPRPPRAGRQHRHMERNRPRYAARPGDAHA